MTASTVDKDIAMTGPLTGVRVIDLTTMLSGPLATMILADQGADVIKVEAPDAGDYTRSLGTRRGGMSAMFLNNNRNKRSICIDLKTGLGVELVLKLAKTADVFVQNFRPGVADRLGIGADALRAENPGLVYASLSGFGPYGPWASKPTYDPIIQSASGLATVQAGSDQERPRLIRTILPDKLSAVTAAQAISAALIARQRSGSGQHVQLSMIDAVLQFLWASDMNAHTFVDDGPTQDAPASFVDLIYQTKNGHMSISIMTDKQWKALCRVLGREEWVNDPRFADAEAREKNVDERLKLMQAALLTGETEFWMEKLEAADVPCTPVLTRAEVYQHPQVLAGNSVVEYDHPQAGRLRQARPAARFDITARKDLRGGPVLGADAVDVLTEAGLSSGEIQEALAGGAVKLPIQGSSGGAHD